MIKRWQTVGWVGDMHQADEHVAGRKTDTDRITQRSRSHEDVMK